MQHLHVRLALLHHLVHGEGEEKFGFELPPGTVEEFAEFVGEFVQRPGREGPAVHGHRAALGQGGPGFPAVLGEHGAPVPPFDPGPLDETGQPAVFIHRADPPGDAAVLGQGVFQGEGRHSDMELCGIRLGPVQKFREQTVAVRTVEIVRVDHHEGPIHHAPAAEDGVAGSPGLDPPLGNGISLGQPVELLIHV